MSLKSLAHDHHAYVKTDSVFQRRARLLQALWREERGLAIGEHRGRPLGSRLAMPEAREELLNYLTEGVRQVVRQEVLDAEKAKDKLYGKPRIFNDLLSSQPLCFNLFGELALDLKAAGRVLSRRVPGLAAVTAIEFEWSPGRGNETYTGDESAFDVFVAYDNLSGTRGFIGIEVKYHENLRDKASGHKARYDQVAQAMGCFRLDAAAALRRTPLQQLWRDHLLAGALLADPAAGFTEGRFVVLYPEPNDRCSKVVNAYRQCLSDAATFNVWTMEALVDDLRAESAGPWVEAFAERYLSWDRTGA